MQILTTSILLLISLFLAETTAYAGHFLENEIFSGAPRESRIRSTAEAKLKRTIRGIRSSSINIEVPQKFTGNTEKRGNTVHIGNGQTTQILQVPVLVCGGQRIDPWAAKRDSLTNCGQYRLRSDRTARAVLSWIYTARYGDTFPSKYTFNEITTYGSILSADSNEVGFHVSLSEAKYVGPNDVRLLFDNIREAIPKQLNGYYDKKTGLFTSPVSGTYLVSLTIANSKDNVILANVMRNRSEKKLSVVSDGRSGASQGSVTGIVRLRAGDTLNVGIEYPLHATVYGDNLSSWSVYLLKKQ